MKADDLSSNSLEGDPPSYIGFIFPYSMSLNVPGNSLQGGIPSSMCQTGQLQILDVFSNRFVGELPEQLMRCQSLSYLQLSNNSLRGQFLSSFSVARNNLSSMTPEQKNQFATFVRVSYEGNCFLCGLPLGSCSGLKGSPTLPPSEHQEDSFMITFIWSFAGSYAVAFFVTVFFLYLDSYYRTLFFDFILVQDSLL
ncbi:hypothetical protein CRG98_006918 [Punica granatum]|uniref:Uncharacterized protein n=1 Tax=Punica granatum TaxID=22663 RepID=A0A2I0KWI9_PUNGR|nr:hypothetical protein CRG98_006918 [Punica granatum]